MDGMTNYAIITNDCIQKLFPCPLAPTKVAEHLLLSALFGQTKSDNKKNLPNIK